jgi:hypothetical protein
LAIGCVIGLNRITNDPECCHESAMR